MTQEEKDLLFKDLTARLPYRVRIQYNDCTCTLDTEYLEYVINDLNGVKLCLRPMTDMTEEERQTEVAYKTLLAEGVGLVEEGVAFLTDFYNSHHLDYRGMIEKGLAIPMTEENDPYKR